MQDRLWQRLLLFGSVARVLVLHYSVYWLRHEREVSVENPGKGSGSRGESMNDGGQGLLKSRIWADPRHPAKPCKTGERRRRNRTRVLCGAT